MEKLKCRNKDAYSSCEYTDKCHPVVCFKALDEFHEMLAEPKRGTWKAKSFFESFCDNCGFSFDVMKCDFLGNMKHCPNCGARMKGADDFVKTHEVVVNGNCAICGKPLNGTKLFLCEGCSEKGADDDTD